MAIVMIVVYILTALIAGRETVTALSSGQNYIIYTLIQALTFVAGVLPGRNHSRVQGHQ